MRCWNVWCNWCCYAIERGSLWVRRIWGPARIHQRWPVHRWRVSTAWIYYDSTAQRIPISLVAPEMNPSQSNLENGNGWGIRISNWCQTLQNEPLIELYTKSLTSALTSSMLHTKCRALIQLNWRILLWIIASFSSSFVNGGENRILNQNQNLKWKYG